MKWDRKKFFDGVRDRIDPTLNQSQVDGLNAILDGLENNATWTIDDNPSRVTKRAAYALATIFHETAGTFQPIHEYGSTNYFNKRYGPNTKVGKSLGNTKAGDGARYAGRGFVQLTGRSNYRKFGIEDTPDDAMKPDVAFHILTEGMFGGTFTGKKFADYINGKSADYVEARHIINGQDKAGLIAGYAVSFEKILNSAAASQQARGGSAVQSKVGTPDNPSDGPTAPPPTPPEQSNQTIVSVPPVQTETPEPTFISKMKTWYAAAPAFLLSALGGLWSWLQGAAMEIIVAFLVSAAVVAIIFIIVNSITRSRDKQRAFLAAEAQKARDFELTKLQLQSAMDPNKQTVRLVPPPVAIPDVVTPPAEDSAGT